MRKFIGIYYSGIKKDILKNYEITLLALPGILFIFIFSYIPLYGLVLPFKNFAYDKGFFGSPWVGLENFKFLFTAESLWRITRNTIGMNALFIFIGTIITLTFALILFELGRKAVRVYQTVMFFPYFLSWVVVSYVVLAFLDMDKGFLRITS